MRGVTIYGSPGCGKTHALVDYAERAEKDGRAVTFLSFSKAAAYEAQRRLQRADIRTLHSMAYQVLGLSPAQVVGSKNLDEFSRQTGFVFKRDRDDDDTEGDEYRALLSYARNRRADPFDLLESGERTLEIGDPRKFQSFLRLYDQWKNTYGYLDFDDMIIQAVSSDALPQCPVICLDEAQDTTPLQWEFFDLLAQGADFVFIAGDDDQAIYEWNGADPHGMEKAEERHQTKRRVLERSFRVPRVLHEWAHGNILNKIGKRVPKVTLPRDADGRIEQYAALEWFDFEQFQRSGGGLVLMRDNRKLRSIRDQLNDSFIAHDVWGGNSLFTNTDARAIRAVLKRNNGQTPTNEEMQALTRRVNPKLKGQDVSKRDWRDVLIINRKGWYEALGEAILREPTIWLSTIHGAKGREAAQVVVDLEMPSRTEASVFESDVNRDAELRVLYVACTRASEVLNLCGTNVLMSM